MPEALSVYRPVPRDLPMILWTEWFRCVRALRPACSRARTFLWMTLALAGLSIRSDLAGVTSFVRACWLVPEAYRRLLHLFHSPALNIERLSSFWIRLVLGLFTPVEASGRPVLVADGLKAPKEGKKMPAVKKLHQESGDNSKSPYIFGHSFQAVGLLVRAALGLVFCVPLASRIHEGVVFCNADRRTLLDKLALLFLSVAQHLETPAILIADAFYASRKVIRPLLEQGHHLVTRVKSNSVAYHPAPRPRKRRRGRPRKYGDKVRLRDLWRQQAAFTEAPSPVYGEHGVTICTRSLDLLWRPVGQLVRFVLVEHPTRGRMILMSTDLSLDPLEILSLYAYRFKIEVSFKQALHTLGTYAYHFWMMDMDPIPRRSGNQFVHKKSKHYRDQVRRKIDAYHRYVQLGCIAQGILQHLSLHYRRTVWARFSSWMRTMKPSQAPSEAVVAQALRSCLPEFLVSAPETHTLKKFLISHTDIDRCPPLRLAS